MSERTVTPIRSLEDSLTHAVSLPGSSTCTGTRSSLVAVFDGKVRYTEFLVPGLVMMSVLQNSFANSSSSLIQSKITGNLVFVLLAPLSPGGFFAAYVAGAMVRGIVVRSRSIIGSLGAALQTIVGGNITLYTELCEKAREDAYQLMLTHASEMGANAIIAARYDANEIADGVTEVLAYGTAVIVERT